MVGTVGESGREMEGVCVGGRIKEGGGDGVLCGRWLGVGRLGVEEEVVEEERSGCVRLGLG